MRVQIQTNLIEKENTLTHTVELDERFFGLEIRYFFSIYYENMII